MARLLVFLTVPALLMSLAPATPVPRPLYYYPTTVGTVLVYAAGESEWRWVVTAVVDGPGGAKLVTVAETSPDNPGRLEEYHTVSVSAAGLAVVRFGDGTPMAPPLVKLRLPAEPGRTWTLDWPPPEPDDKTPWRGRIGGIEDDATVPAGRFHAVRVDTGYGDDLEFSTSSEWYAPGVGMIARTGGTWWAPMTELKSVTPGTGTLPPGTKVHPRSE